MKIPLSLSPVFTTSKRQNSHTPAEADGPLSEPAAHENILALCAWRRNQCIQCIPSSHQKWSLTRPVRYSVLQRWSVNAKPGRITYLFFSQIKSILEIKDMCRAWDNSVDELLSSDHDSKESREPFRCVHANHTFLNIYLWVSA